MYEIESGCTDLVNSMGVSHRRKTVTSSLSGSENPKLGVVEGFGSCLMNGTGVLTEGGFVPIENIRVGDTVFAEDGILYKVRWVYHRYSQRAYGVMLSDGSKIVCGGDNLWKVRKSGSSKWETLTTLMLLGSSDYETPTHEPAHFNTYERDGCLPVLATTGSENEVLVNKRIVVVKELDYVMDMTGLVVGSPDGSYVIEYFVTAQSAVDISSERS